MEQAAVLQGRPFLPAAVLLGGVGLSGTPPSLGTELESWSSGETLPGASLWRSAWAEEASEGAMGDPVPPGAAGTTTQSWESWEPRAFPRHPPCSCLCTCLSVQMQFSVLTRPYSLCKV